MAARRNEEYAAADEAIKLLAKKAAARYSKTWTKLQQLKFDELNVIREAETLYKALDADNRDAYIRLARRQYQKHDGPKSNKSWKKWLLLLLAEYNPVMEYIYDNEVERKRDRMQESVIGAPASEKRAAYVRAANAWGKQTGWFADAVADAASLEAFDDMGFKFVQWHTQEDSRVCPVCEERDKKIYPIDDIPAKPHPGCRCWYTPVDHR